MIQVTLFRVELDYPVQFAAFRSEDERTEFSLPLEVWERMGSPARMFVTAVGSK